jgi:hypothetical protein
MGNGSRRDHQGEDQQRADGRRVQRLGVPPAFEAYPTMLNKPIRFVFFREAR